MVIVMEDGIAPELTTAAIERLEGFGLVVQRVAGAGQEILIVTGAALPDRREVEMYPGVLRVVRTRRPYRLASRRFHPDDTRIVLGDVVIGGEEIVIMAGPCSAETPEQVAASAAAARRGGARLLRGGAFKPRTSPYSFQGLGEAGLQLLRRAADREGLKLVSEAMDITQLPLVADYADVIQVGARNMQNYSLLRALGQLRKPVLLKRGMAATVEELLLAAEYLLVGGNHEVILCERGIRTFETATRHTLDLAALPVLKRLTHLPVVVDPSHAAGYRNCVPPLALAAVAAGADGLLIEIHPSPEGALSDGPQALEPGEFERLMSGLRRVAEAVGRHVAAPRAAAIL